MRKELPRYQQEVSKAIDSMDSEVSKKRAAVEKTMTAARTEDINCRSIPEQAVDQNPVWRPSELLTDDVLVQIIVKSHEAAVGRSAKKRQPGGEIITSCMNFLQTGRMSLQSVAENIITCLECGVARNISWMSRRISAHTHRPTDDCKCRQCQFRKHSEFKHLSNVKKANFKILGPIYKISYDNLTITTKIPIDLRRPYNLRNKLRKAVHLQIKCKIVRSFVTVFANWLMAFIKEILSHRKSLL